MRVKTHNFKHALLSPGEPALLREGLAAEAPAWVVPKYGKCWGKDSHSKAFISSLRRQAGGLSWQWQAHSPWPLIWLPLLLCALASCTQVPQHLWASLYGCDWGWEKGVTCSRAAFLYLPNNYSLTKVLKSITFPDSIFLIFTAVAIGSSAISIYFPFFPRASDAS